MDGYLIENPKQQNILIALICAGAFIANLDATIVNITLPVLSREFSASPGSVSWTVLAYLLFEAGFMLPMGKLADLKGIKKVYLAGFVIFFLGSLACGVSLNLGQLVVFRAFQGIGGAMLFTVMMSFIPLYLPPQRRVFATGLVTTAAAAGVGLGPPLGGWLATTLGWRWIFFVNLPFCAAAVAAGYRLLPSIFPLSADKRFDFAGAVFSFLAFVFLLFAVNKGLEWGWTSPAILACFCASGLALALFIRRQKKTDYPLIDFRLFRNRVISFGLLSVSISLLTMGGILFLFPFYLIEGRGLDAHSAGLIMVLVSAGSFAGPCTGRLADRFGVMRVCYAGLALGVASFALFLGLEHDSPLIYIGLVLGLFGLSQGLSKAPSIALIMNAAPPDEKNDLAGILSLCRSLSIALGVLFFETIFSEAIPAGISQNDTHIAAAIAHPRELAAGFRGDFVFGILVSLLAVGFMAAARKKPPA